jgi:hypothetical protein
MGRRTEHRIAACLPVVVHGVDDRGNPFTQTASTLNVSASGARLQGLECIGRPGSTIEIEHEDRKALFRVQWIGEQGSSRTGQVGVRCLDAGKYIWGVQLTESGADDYDPFGSTPAATVPSGSSPLNAISVPWAGKDRRQFPRLACRLEAQVTTPEASTQLNAKVIDICLGGCYLEMMSPFPVGSIAEMVVDLGETTIAARGKVCNTHPGIGMGVSFTGMRPDDLAKLRQFVPPVQNVPELPPAMPAMPQVSPGPAPVEVAAVAASSGKSLPSAAQGLEAVVRVLLRKGILDRSELFDEIERLKARRN